MGARGDITQTGVRMPQVTWCILFSGGQGARIGVSASMIQLILSVKATGTAGDWAGCKA